MTIELDLEMFMEKISDLKELNFKGELPAVIDFWAPWCGPCKILSPIVEKLSEEYKGKIDFYKINTDEESELAELFQIRSIPSLLFLKKDSDPQMSIGALTENKFKEVLDSLI